MEIYIRCNSAGDFRKNFAERDLGSFVKVHGNLFNTVDSLSGKWETGIVGKDYKVNEY